MNDTPKHTKIRTSTLKADGSVQIDTETYHEKLSSVTQEVMKHTKTSRDTFLSDLIQAVDVITNQTSREVTITIKSDERYQPNMITKVWVVKKETFNKR